MDQYLEKLAFRRAELEASNIASATENQIRDLVWIASSQHIDHHLSHKHLCVGEHPRQRP